MNEEKLLISIKNEISSVDIGMYSALSLAYIGDSVFDIYVRAKIMSSGNQPVNVMHKKSKDYVNAKAQSEMYYRLLDFLTEEEMSVIKRGRNAKSFTKAKNASVSDYRHATGVEALFGFLFLKGETERITELFKICLED